MEVKRDYFLGALFWVCIGGLAVWGFHAFADKRNEKQSTTSSTSDDRKRAVADAVKAGPQVESWTTPQGDVVAIYIPSSSVGGRRVAIKRCIVWRDAVNHTSTMSCPGDETDRIYTPTDEPEPPEYER